MKTKEEIEKLANEFSKDYIKTTNNSILQSSFKLEVGYIKGYTQCQEDMADKPKQETLEEVAERLYGKLEIGIGAERRLVFIAGAKWQQDMADKKYTEEDIRKAIFLSSISNTDFIPDRCDEIINSLNKKDK
jgi:hypothetical protein